MPMAASWMRHSQAHWGRCALRRRTPAVVDFDGAWLGGNAGVRVMNLAVKREN
jgi:hypothetical protein